MKFLHLDDHTLFAEGLAAVLKQKLQHKLQSKLQSKLQNKPQDLEIVTALTAQSALAHVDQYEHFDLILIDLSMPGLDGLAFIESLKQRQLFIPFVVLSASENLWDIRQAMSQGAAAFIPKTTSSDEIVAIIKSVLEGEVYLPEGMQQALAQLPAKQPNASKQKLLRAYQLGQRQMDVLQLMQQGYSTDEIAAVLNLSRNTIKSHTRTLFNAFDVKNRLECVRYAERRGILN